MCAICVLVTHMPFLWQILRYGQQHNRGGLEGSRGGRLWHRRLRGERTDDWIHKFDAHFWKLSTGAVVSRIWESRESQNVLPPTQI